VLTLKTFSSFSACCLGINLVPSPLDSPTLGKHSFVKLRSNCLTMLHLDSAKHSLFTLASVLDTWSLRTKILRFLLVQVIHSNWPNKKVMRTGETWLSECSYSVPIDLSRPIPRILSLVEGIPQPKGRGKGKSATCKVSYPSYMSSLCLFSLDFVHFIKCFT
jgi:hypothetical protein